jgi:hypothetical protein
VVEMQQATVEAYLITPVTGDFLRAQWTNR